MQSEVVSEMRRISRFDVDEVDEGALGRDLTNGRLCSDVLAWTELHPM